MIPQDLRKQPTSNKDHDTNGPLTEKISFYILRRLHRFDANSIYFLFPDAQICIYVHPNLTSLYIYTFWQSANIRGIPQYGSSVFKETTNPGLANRKFVRKPRFNGHICMYSQLTNKKLLYKQNKHFLILTLSVPSIEKTF